MIADAEGCNLGDGIITGTSAAIPSQGYWEIPLYPVMAVNLASNTNTTCWNSEVGIALNGVSFDQATDVDTCADALHGGKAALLTCAVGTDEDGIYNYKMQPSCLLEQLGNVAQSFPMVGSNGFPIWRLRSCGIVMETASQAPMRRSWYLAQPTEDETCLLFRRV